MKIKCKKNAKNQEKKLKKKTWGKCKKTRKTRKKKRENTQKCKKTAKIRLFSCDWLYQLCKLFVINRKQRGIEGFFDIIMALWIAKGTDRINDPKNAFEAPARFYGR